MFMPPSSLPTTMPPRSPTDSPASLPSLPRVCHRAGRSWIVALVSLAVAAGPARADAPPGVLLFRPDSLIGWDYAAGTEGAAGWMISEGRLRGQAPEEPLVSGFSFGQVELRFAWSVSKGGAVELRLLSVPDGEPITLLLCEGDGCGRIARGDGELVAGRRLDSSSGEHTAVVRRGAGKLALEIDGQGWTEVELPDQPRVALGLGVPRGEATLGDLRAVEPPGEPLFNGKDFAGWTTPGNIKKWTYEDDGTVRMEGAGNYLRSEKLYGNFTLSLEFKMKKGGNSGLGLRTPPGGWPSSDGMELQWYDRASASPGVHDNLAIYGNVEPLEFNLRSEQWNHLVVKADGWMISAWLNGVLVQHYNTFDHPELRHRNLKGWIGFQDHGAWIRLRNARILEAPEGEGLAAWRRVDGRRAGARIIERLVNPGAVAWPDGTLSRAATAQVPDGDSEERTVAELSGPGAVVRIASETTQGRLRFYFDGEPQPRIDRPIENLRGALPQLSEDRWPVLSCVMFSKSLRLTASEAAGNRLRIDYVVFPPEYRVETFSGVAAGFPRSWLPATIYHQQKFQWGATRALEPLPLLRAERKTIPAGGREVLLRTEGAGLVERFRLLAPKRVLDNQNLWIEVAVDAHDEPAIAAPARYWFPGLVGQSNWANTLMVEQGGLATVLAMPFGDGISISAVNRGDASIEGVGAEILVRPAELLGDAPGALPGPAASDGQPGAPRVRLFGRFLPAGQQPDRLAAGESAGWARWVGVVWEVADSAAADAAPAIEGLWVDEQPRDGWASPSFDLLLGRQGEFRACLAGRKGRLAWVYPILAPAEFERSFALRLAGPLQADRLVWYYATVK